MAAQIGMCRVVSDLEVRRTRLMQVQLHQLHHTLAAVLTARLLEVVEQYKTGVSLLVL